MNLLKFYQVTNKWQNIAIISLVLISIILIVIHNIFQNTIIVLSQEIDFIFNLFSGLIMVIIVLTIVLVLINGFINIIGKRRETIMRLYGKKAYLKYLLIINTGTFITVFILVNVLIYQLINSSNFLKNIPFKIIFERLLNYDSTIILIGLSLNIILFIYLHSKEIVFQNNYKYKLKKQRNWKLFKKLLMQVLIIIVISFISFITYLIGTSHHEGLEYYFIYINLSHVYVFTVFITIFVVIICEYINNFLDETFL